MSGFHPNIGTFELTATKAAYWLRRSNFPDACNGLSGMKFYAALLGHFGHKVVKLSQNYLHVHATPGQVWEALSGQPSNPEHEQYYTGKAAPKAKPVSPPSGRVRLLSEDAITLFKSGVDGSGRPVGEAVASGRGACRICGELIAKGTSCLAGGYDFLNGPHGPQPTKCYVHTECLKKV